MAAPRCTPHKSSFVGPLAVSCQSLVAQRLQKPARRRHFGWRQFPFNLSRPEIFLVYLFAELINDQQLGGGHSRSRSSCPTAHPSNKVASPLQQNATLRQRAINLHSGFFLRRMSAPAARGTEVQYFLHTYFHAATLPQPTCFSYYCATERRHARHSTNAKKAVKPLMRKPRAWGFPAARTDSVVFSKATRRSLDGGRPYLPAIAR